MNRTTYLTCGVLAACFTASTVSASVIEFDEANPLPANLSSLAGSNAFAVDGIHFAGQTVFVNDQRFVGAGTDAYGIATSTSVNSTIPVGQVLFDSALSSLTIDAVSVGTDFTADAYDGNVLVGTFTAAGVSGANYFTHTFTGHITRMDFHDHGGYVGIGRLTTVFDPAVTSPEPQAVMVLPAAGLLMLRRRASRA